MIFVTCALHCEAKPIIERYRLTADRKAFFPVFKSDQLTLVVTGVGKLLMSSAMTYVYARYNEPNHAAWLNVGVAGMKSAALGDFFNINKVTDQHSGVNWYPVRLPDLVSDLSCSLITLDAPGNNYTANDAYDMEASAFMISALRFSSVELVQLVKIVSDNESNTMEDVNKKQVTMLLTNKISQIDEVIESLKQASFAFLENYSDADLYEQCMGKWRFSEYQQKQLGRLLQQWLALDESVSIDSIENLQTSKQVIAFVNEKLRILAIGFTHD